jgi:hypothetical protein
VPAARKPSDERHCKPHADFTARQDLGEQGPDPVSPDKLASQNCLFVPIDTMHLKDVLCQIAPTRISFMVDSFFPNRLCGKSSLALVCPQGEEESILLLLAGCRVQSGSTPGLRRPLFHQKVVGLFAVRHRFCHPPRLTTAACLGLRARPDIQG